MLVKFNPVKRFPPFSFMRKFSLFLFLLVVTHFLCGQVNVGIITDLTESARVRFIVDSLIQEIDKTTGVNTSVNSSEDIQFFDLSTEAEVQDTYRSIKADFIIAIGGLSTKSLSQLPSLPIPVIGLGVIDPFIQQIPFENGKSGKKNFTYILTARDIVEEIKSFKKLVGFEQLILLMDPAANRSINLSMRQVLVDSIEQELDIQVSIVQAVENVEDVIQNIDSAEAVYFTSLISRDQAHVKAISDYLIEQKIPSFSASRQHVELGVLGSSSGDNGFQQVLRRIAILSDDILAGRDAGELLVTLNTSERFNLNVETAEKISLSPPFEVALTANLVGNRGNGSSVYTFVEIANKALEENLNLKISYKDIDIAELDVQLSRSNILPSLTSGLTGIQINEERANASFNSPERSLDLDFTLTQVIYSEEALASIKIGQYLKQAQEYQTEVDVLNVLFDTYNAYLNILSAKTNLAIQRENHDNTRINLELAKVRVDIGSTDNSDLYRWESELANATQSLVEAQTSLIAAKIQMSNLLANTLEDDFEVNDIGIEGDIFTQYRNGLLAGLVRTPQDLKIASDFLVEESIANNPNKMQLLENIKATERQLKLNKRLLYVPTIALQAQFTQTLSRGGEGSEMEPSNPMAPSFGNGLQDNSWFVGLSLSYPIFTGNSRRVNKQRSQIQLEQLNYSNTSLDQALDLSIRTSTVRLLNTTTNLSFSRTSAESALQNFKLVQNKYKAGNANITQLIDAQQAALGAQLGAALSVYEYIAANLQIEYGLGFFSMFSSEDELSDFQSRFLEYVSNR